MLQNIIPNRRKSKAGGLTPDEKPLVKGLLESGYVAQDIVHIVNQGRISTINLARISAVNKEVGLVSATKDEIDKYIKIQQSYDPKTLLNPYKDRRLISAREAMICAVQTYNNPAIIFKVETFCVLINIAWTYLIHEKLERQLEGSSKQKDGRSIILSGILKKDDCPIEENAVKENLRKIIEVRNAVEHTYFDAVEQCFGGLFQACCINFDNYLVEWFGKELSLSNELSLALQFVRININ